MEVPDDLESLPLDQLHALVDRLGIHYMSTSSRDAIIRHIRHCVC